MKRTYKRWVLGLLAGFLAILTLCAIFVYAVDPCLYFRYPKKWDPVFFNERYQTAGLAKNTDADTVLLGTSMVANYRVSHVEKTFGGAAVKLTIPDGYLSEFDDVMQVEWRNHDPSRVIFGLDTNILIRDESEKTGAMPEYLYNKNRLDDIQYLLNKDTLYYSFYTLLENREGAVSAADDAFTWDQGLWWNHQTALKNYDRPAAVNSVLPSDTYLKNVRDNLSVVEGWITAHPDTEFDIFFPPYSILYWDKERRLGETDAVFSALDAAFDILLKYDNVKVFYFPSDEKIVTNLDNYCDYIHHSGKVCDVLLKMIKNGKYQITEKNAVKTLADWREYVVDYDYEPFWTTAFWEAWNQKSHPLS